MGAQLQIYDSRRKLESAVKKIEDSSTISKKNRKAMLWFNDILLAIFNHHP